MDTSEVNNTESASKANSFQHTPSYYSTKTNQMELAEEEAVVQQAIHGNSTALAKLYESNLEKVYRYIYSRVHNISEAENLTSETFTRALEALLNGHYIWQGKSFSAWLYGIALRVIQENQRKWQQLPTSEGLEDLVEHPELVSGQVDALDFLIQKEEQEAIWQLVKDLPVEEQRIVILRHVYALPYAEIAKRLGRSENACKQLHYRALKKLKFKAQEADIWTEVTKSRANGMQKSR